MERSMLTADVVGLLWEHGDLDMDSRRNIRASCRTNRLAVDSLVTSLRWTWAAYAKDKAYEAKSVRGVCAKFPRLRQLRLRSASALKQAFSMEDAEGSGSQGTAIPLVGTSCPGLAEVSLVQHEGYSSFGGCFYMVDHDFVEPEDDTPYDPALMILQPDRYTDESPRRKFTQVAHFGVPELQTISTLAGRLLTDLTLFCASRLTELTPLSGCPQLVRLGLGYCMGFQDLSPLHALSRLEYLDLRHCTGVTTLGPLGALSSLLHLDLSGCQVPSVDALRSLTRLQTLALPGSATTSLEPLSQLVQLSYLDVRSSDVDALSPLSGLKQLQKLDVSDCLLEDPDSDFRALCGLVHLRELWAQGLPADVVVEHSDLAVRHPKFGICVEDQPFNPSASPLGQTRQLLEGYARAMRLSIPEDSLIVVCGEGDGPDPWNLFHLDGDEDFDDDFMDDMLDDDDDDWDDEDEDEWDDGQGWGWLHGHANPLPHRLGLPPPGGPLESGESEPPPSSSESPSSGSGSGSEPADSGLSEESEDGEGAESEPPETLDASHSGDREQQPEPADDQLHR